MEVSLKVGCSPYAIEKQPVAYSEFHKRGVISCLATNASSKGGQTIFSCGHGWFFLAKGAIHLPINILQEAVIYNHD